VAIICVKKKKKDILKLFLPHPQVYIDFGDVPRGMMEILGQWRIFKGIHLV